MDRDYILSCCSPVDLPREKLREREISYICMHYFLDGKEYPDDLGVSMPIDQFYQAMRDGAETKTSQVNVDEFMTYFRTFLDQGKDVFHVSLSSGISGTWNSACIAQQNLLEEYPERRIWIVDSLCASAGYGLFMDLLADQRDRGLSGEELFNWANQNRLHIQHWFFSEDLTWYIKGGRISKASGLFGTVLHICPLLNVNEEGKLIPRYKLRGEKAAIRAAVRQMEHRAENGTRYSGKCFISHSGCYEDACAEAELIEERFPNLKGKIQISDIGTTIGSHTGPGTVALFFVGEERGQGFGLFGQ